MCPQTVPELKELCAQVGLPKSGKKQELIDRLELHPVGAGSAIGGGGGGAGVRGGGALGAGGASSTEGRTCGGPSIQGCAKTSSGDNGTGASPVSSLTCAGGYPPTKSHQSPTQL